MSDWVLNAPLCSEHISKKHLRFEPRIYLGENQKKEKEPFLKTAVSGTFSCYASL